MSIYRKKYSFVANVPNAHEGIFFTVNRHLYHSCLFLINTHQSQKGIGINVSIYVS